MWSSTFDKLIFCVEINGQFDTILLIDYQKDQNKLLVLFVWNCLPQPIEIPPTDKILLKEIKNFSFMWRFLFFTNF